MSNVYEKYKIQDFISINNGNTSILNFSLKEFSALIIVLIIILVDKKKEEF